MYTLLTKSDNIVTCSMGDDLQWYLWMVGNCEMVC